MGKIFDFVLTDEEMKRIKAPDNGKRFYCATLEEQKKNFAIFCHMDVGGSSGPERCERFRLAL